MSVLMPQGYTACP